MFRKLTWEIPNELARNAQSANTQAKVNQLSTRNNTKYMLYYCYTSAESEREERTIHIYVNNIHK